MAIRVQSGLVIGDAAASLQGSVLSKFLSSQNGVLLAVMTTAERLLIENPAVGFVVFDSDLLGFFRYNGSAWIEIITGGGGGVNESNIVSTAVNYIATFTDYIIVGTADCEIKLPQIGANVGTVFKIFAKNATIDIVAFAGDTINNVSVQTLTAYSMVTIRAIFSNEWLIGD